jgi:hypothetical protein
MLTKVIERFFSSRKLISQTLVGQAIAAVRNLRPSVSIDFELTGQEGGWHSKISESPHGFKECSQACVRCYNMMRQKRFDIVVAIAVGPYCLVAAHKISVRNVVDADNIIHVVVGSLRITVGA